MARYSQTPRRYPVSVRATMPELQQLKQLARRRNTSMNLVICDLISAEHDRVGPQRAK